MGKRNKNKEGKIIHLLPNNEHKRNESKGELTHDRVRLITWFARLAKKALWVTHILGSVQLVLLVFVLVVHNVPTSVALHHQLTVFICFVDPLNHWE